ncbi:hypothetical protein [Dactylosporangium sp. CA-139066]|uniref:hypothetical protein n=1 Tax=Dactylosporangium sp. CA-139066 TaxID=3239930 RepID=UPI003D91021C
MERPIGYWLRELDRRLESTFATVLAARGVERREWQVLNGLGPDSPFWGAGERPYASVVSALAARGWAGADGAVTVAGEAARAEILAEVEQIRARAMVGVSDEDYRTTVRTLAAMSANLG